MFDNVPHDTILTGTEPYSGAVLGCFVAWCVVAFAYREYIFGEFNILRGGTAAEKLLDKHSKLFGHYLNWAVLLGVLMAGLACLRYAGTYAGADVPRWMAVAAIPAMWIVVAAVWGYQWIMLKIVGEVTTRREFTGRLFYLRKIVAATGTMTVMPLFLLFVLTGGAAGDILGWAVAGACALFLIFLMARTLSLFVRQRFSILHWFLYLCAVEIFPWSVVVILAGKLQ